MSRDILLSEIIPDSDQPRKHFEQSNLQELAASMRQSGLIVPILVRPQNGRFVIVHGERRYRAAQLLGWATIAAEVKELSDNDAAMMALIENIQRANLTPIEEAEAYQVHINQGLTQTELGERIGKSQSYIASKLRLLKLHPQVQLLLAEGRLTEGHAKQLLRVHNDTVQSLFGRLATFREITVKQLKMDVDAYLRSCQYENMPPFWYLVFFADWVTGGHELGCWQRVDKKPFEPIPDNVIKSCQFLGGLSGDHRSVLFDGDIDSIGKDNPHLAERVAVSVACVGFFLDGNINNDNETTSNRIV